MTYTVKCPSQKCLTNHSKYKNICAGVGDSVARQAGGVWPTPAQCWPTAYDIHPPPNQPRPNTPAWRDKRFIDKLDGARNGTEFWNSFFWVTGAKIRGTRKTPLLRSYGTHTDNDKERADTFAASLDQVHNFHQVTIFDDEFKVEVENTINGSVLHNHPHWGETI